jgi:DNA-binding transcriptional MocR family regulator
VWTVMQAPPKQEMAHMIGASREMVSRVMTDLQQRGYIRAEKRKVILLDKMSMSNRARLSQPGHGKRTAFGR